MPSTEPDSHDHRPIHQRIAADLRDQIMSGDLPPGGNLPPTSQLMKRFKASNATVQRAVQLLKVEGLARGRTGSAVTVREHRRRLITPANYSAPADPGRPYRWLSEAAQQGFQPSSTLLAVEVTRPPADVCVALDLGSDGTAVLRTQVLALNGEPAELVQSYYPLELAHGTAITEKRKIRGGTPTLLAGLGYLLASSLRFCSSPASSPCCEPFASSTAITSALSRQRSWLRRDICTSFNTASGLEMSADKPVSASVARFGRLSTSQGLKALHTQDGGGPSEYARPRSTRAARRPQESQVREYSATQPVVIKKMNPRLALSKPPGGCWSEDLNQPLSVAGVDVVKRTRLSGRCKAAPRRGRISDLLVPLRWGAFAVSTPTRATSEVGWG
jgi:GntR family transcriptional regulator